MKLTIALFVLFSLNFTNATEKDETLSIAKGVQCTYLREKSFLDVYDLYSAEKSNSDYIKKVSDSIYALAFKICDPENTINADKEILSVCSTSCDQSATKGMLGLGGPSTDDIAKCKKACMNYSDHLGHFYMGATKALAKFIPTIPACPKKVECPVIAPAPTAATEVKAEEKKEEKKE